MRAVFATIVLAVSMPAFAAPPSDEAALLQLKQHDWPKAYFQQDTRLLDSILHDKFQMIDAGGDKSTKAEELAYVAKTKPSYSSLTYKVTRLDIFPNGTAIVAGEGTVVGKRKDGSPSTSTYQSTNVLIKEDGKWKAIASHVSGVREK
jgi:ketosteroid isomerase-like protein